MSRRLVLNGPVLAKPAVLLTESANEFNALLAHVEREIKPRGIIEHMYVADIAWISWEIRRLRRCKVLIINTAFRAALQNLLTRLLREPGQFDDGAQDEAEPLALAWFTDEEARKKVCQILRRFKLDEFAIEAEAIRGSFCELEALERMLASLESRRNKALRCAAEYRTSLARQLRESTDRIIDSKNIRRLEHAAGKKSAAA